jgi:hypothetical protein
MVRGVVMTIHPLHEHRPVGDDDVRVEADAHPAPDQWPLRPVLIRHAWVTAADSVEPRDRRAA